MVQGGECVQEIQSLQSLDSGVFECDRMIDIKTSYDSFSLCFETGSYYVALAGPEITETYLSLLIGAGTKGVHYYSWQVSKGFVPHVYSSHCVQTVENLESLKMMV